MDEALKTRVIKIEEDGPIDMNEVDFSLKRPDLVDQAVGDELHFFGKTENDVRVFKDQVVDFLPKLDPLSKRFLMAWHGQEIVHGEIADTTQRMIGREPAEIKYENTANLYKIGGAISHIPGIHNIWHMIYLTRGAMQERLTRGGYDILRDKLLSIGERALVETAMTRIISQEANHLGYYRQAARLQKGKLADWQLWFARSISERTYSPVGTTTKDQKRQFGKLAISLAGDNYLEMAHPVQAIAAELLASEDRPKISQFALKALEDCVQSYLAA